MAIIDWEIAGHVTPLGEVRICGSSSGGDTLFDEPLDIPAMIGSFSESHELSEDHRLSSEGRTQLGALAVTLAEAQEEVRTRLLQDDLLKAKTRPGARSKKVRRTVSFTGDPRLART